MHIFLQVPLFLLTGAYCLCIIKVSLGNIPCTYFDLLLLWPGQMGINASMPGFTNYALRSLRNPQWFLMCCQGVYYDS